MYAPDADRIVLAALLMPYRPDEARALLIAWAEQYADGLDVALAHVEAVSILNPDEDPDPDADPPSEAAIAV